MSQSNPETGAAPSPWQPCPQCGAPMPADAPAGLCPKCLLQVGLDSGLANPSGPSGETADYQPRSLPPSLEQLAEKFPQLEIIERIGQGGMGVVYKARQKDLDRIIALKVLRPGIENDPAFAERFVREARALARLSHPAIITVHDFGRSDGFYYLMMEYVAGANLRELKRSGKLLPAEALAIVPQICEPLQYAHDQGVVHRDIKPENILVDTQGRVKIADFGLAKMVGAVPDAEALTGAWQVMGTPGYMAPEQMKGSHEVDHRADIYSLGVVIYEMLTGELPSGRFALPSQKVRVDVRLDEVVLRAMEREPTLRYQKASEVQSDVESICGVSREAVPRIHGHEFRSQTMLFGVPLVHIDFGWDPRTGRARTAKGILAIGNRAVGVVAIGGVAAGGVAIGGAALGLVSLGGLAIGAMAAGGAALGGFALGGAAVGGIALGGAAIGHYAFGGSAWGRYAMDGSNRDPEAIRFFEPWAAEAMSWLWLAGIGMAMFMGLLFPVLRLVLYAQNRSAGGRTRRPGSSGGPSSGSGRSASSDPTLAMSNRVHRGPGPVTMASSHEPSRVSDLILGRRLIAFSLVAYVGWAILLMTGHLGYVRGAAWYFQQELAYQYMIQGIVLFGSVLLGSLLWWWYLRAKRPEVPRSLADCWETFQRPDPRSLRLLLCIAVFLCLWGLAVVPAMLAGSDAFQALLMLMPFLLGPPLFIAAVRWSYGAALFGKPLSVECREFAQNHPELMKLLSACFHLLLIVAYLLAFMMFFGARGSGGPGFTRLEYSIGFPFHWYEFEMEKDVGGRMRVILWSPAWLIAAGAFGLIQLALRFRPPQSPLSVWELPHSHAVMWFVAALAGVLWGYVVGALTAEPEPHRGFAYTIIGIWVAILLFSVLLLYWTHRTDDRPEQVGTG